MSHPLFSDAERVALDVAREAALVPNGVTDELFDRLRLFFDETQVVELVSVISLFGFLNRWNATLGTKVEDVVIDGLAELG
jgi:alkylhydroperoxidase family enzyme